MAAQTSGRMMGRWSCIVIRCPPLPWAGAKIGLVSGSGGVSSGPRRMSLAM